LGKTGGTGLLDEGATKGVDGRAGLRGKNCVLGFQTVGDRRVFIIRLLPDTPGTESAGRPFFSGRNTGNRASHPLWTPARRPFR